MKEKVIQKMYHTNYIKIIYQCPSNLLREAKFNPHEVHFHVSITRNLAI